MMMMMLLRWMPQLSSSTLSNLTSYVPKGVIGLNELGSSATLETAKARPTANKGPTLRGLNRSRVNVVVSRLWNLGGCSGGGRDMPPVVVGSCSLLCSSPFVYMHCICK